MAETTKRSLFVIVWNENDVVGIIKTGKGAVRDVVRKISAFAAEKGIYWEIVTGSDTLEQILRDEGIHRQVTGSDTLEQTLRAL